MSDNSKENFNDNNELGVGKAYLNTMGHQKTATDQIFELDSQIKELR